MTAVGSFLGDAKEFIDASGLTAVPGFIDSHSHLDQTVPFFPKCENLILQGVTTGVAGHCGFTLAPLGDFVWLPGPGYGHMEPVTELIHNLVGYKYYPTTTLFSRDFVNEIMKEKFGWTIDWETMGDFFKVLESKGISCNYAPIVGHGAVRTYVMRDDCKRQATKPERAEMAGLIRQAMDEGCIGLSVGLDYDPDCFASREELVEHVSILKDYQGVFCPHSRRTGRRRDMAAGHRMPDKTDAIQEVLDICRAAGVRMNIAHIYTGWYLSPQGGPEILEQANREATLTIIDKALKEGLDVSFDAIPSALSTTFGGWSYLCGQFAPWLRELGSRAEFAKWLRVADFREEIKDAISKGKWYMRETYNPNLNPRWAENITVLKHTSSQCENKNLAQIAEERKRNPLDVWFDLITENPDSKCVIGGGENPMASYHATFYKHTVASVGLDTTVVDYQWDSQVPPWSAHGISGFSAFVGFFDKFVNKQNELTLEQAVCKSSTQTAKRFNLKGRGVIREGSYADIVLMDLPNLEVVGTPLDPKQQPKGINYVFVNGIAVVKNAKHTGATPGRVLRRE